MNELKINIQADEQGGFIALLDCPFRVIEGDTLEKVFDVLTEGANDLPDVEKKGEIIYFWTGT